MIQSLEVEMVSHYYTFISYHLPHGFHRVSYCFSIFLNVNEKTSKRKYKKVSNATSQFSLDD